MSQDHKLPIDTLRDRVLSQVEAGPLVVTATTGAGKSTQVPRWCRRGGRVVVVEPRRVACRGLAGRVAELEGVPLGGRVGYSVRDDHRAGRDTEILFVTPGVLIRWLAERSTPPFGTLILDEYHERRQDMDLLLAIAAGLETRLVVMSATLDGARVARHLGGEHLHAEGRQHPVTLRYTAGRTTLPDPRGLEERLVTAVRQAADVPGDILVFLPGKGEIQGAATLLGREGSLEILTVHGGLSLEEQSRIFRPGQKRRVILSTNVAETSITVPGIGVVIDSGLVRQTRYHNGRGFLTLVPIALDSAEQRAGRAGRLGPGVCWRLWSEQARLAPHTVPEIHRESLADMVLAAAACRTRPEKLPFLDPPKEYALEAARGDLQALGALDGDGAITRRGREVFGLPLDAPLGSLIVEGERRGALEPAIDLAAALSGGRPLYRLPEGGEIEGLPETGCDATLLIAALRGELPERVRPDAFQVREARSLRSRLRRAWELPATPSYTFNRMEFALTAIAADPRCAYIPRRRRGRTFWSNGGTEAELGRESSIQADRTEALIALETRALGQSALKQKLIITRAVPARTAWLARAGLGEPEAGGIRLKGGSIHVSVRRIYAGVLLDEREETPTGDLARQALVRLVLEGRLFGEILPELRRRLDRRNLAARLGRAGLLPAEWESALPPGTPPQDEASWLHDRLDRVGFDSGADLELLAGEDLLPPALPPALAETLDRTWPRTLRPGGAVYRVEYDFRNREVTLSPEGRVPKSPPALTLLPRFQGFRIRVQHHSRTWVLRER